LTGKAVEFNNLGKLEKEGGTNTYADFVGVHISNSGTVNINQGRLALSKTYDQGSGNTVIANGGRMRAEDFIIQGGTFGGDGYVVGKVTNKAGTFAPGGSPGLFSIFSNKGYVQQAKAELQIELKDPTGKGSVLISCPCRDQFNSTGRLRLVFCLGSTATNSLSLSPA
jgi:hypothetical protein